MTPISQITKHIASPWDICPRCAGDTFSYSDVDANGIPERLVWKCPKCGPVQVLTSTRPDMLIPGVNLPAGVTGE